MALEMVFNIRPFAEEFLNTMAKDFEITVFTAGEQDVSQILNQLLFIRFASKSVFIQTFLLLFEKFSCTIYRT